MKMTPSCLGRYWTGNIMAYMIYQQYTTAVKQAYAGQDSVKEQYAMASQCREWLVRANIGGTDDSYDDPATTIEFERGGTATADIVWYTVEIPAVKLLRPDASGLLWLVGDTEAIEF